ncbi:MAG: iron ABC transporter permease [Proteobacteria bacterium]|nr:iron ABC transporter permease [Pseudomonadota bacterium]MBU4354731.1 iron ABC transporter permease [Pseudomonadota bacterium]
MNKLYMPYAGQVLILLMALFFWLPYLDAYMSCVWNLLGNSLSVLPTFLSARSLGLLYNTIVIGLGTALGSLAIGLPMGYWLGQSPFKTRPLWIYAGLAPILIPPHINVMVWTDILGPKGLLNNLLMLHLSLDGPLVNIMSLGGAVLVLTLSYFPYLTLFVLSAILSLDPSLEEAGWLSLNRRQVFWRITFPFIRPYLAAGLIIVFVFATGNYGVPALLGVHTYPVETFAEFSVFFSTDRAIMAALPLLLLVSGLIIWHWQLMRRRDFSVLSPQSFVKITPRIPHASLIAFFLGTFIFLAVVLPLAWILWESASWRNYATALQTAWLPIVTTLVLAVSTASLAVLFCYPAAYFIVRTRTWSAFFLDLVSFLPLAIPGTILGVGLIRVWNHPATGFLYGSAAILLVAYLAQFSSFALRCLVPSMHQISPRLEDSYLIYRRGWLRRQVHIVGPLARNGMSAAWILVFVLCLGELGSTLLIIPPGMETLSLRIYNLLHYGAHEIVAALSVILLSLTLVPLAVLFWKRPGIMNT